MPGRAIRPVPAAALAVALAAGAALAYAAPGFILAWGSAGSGLGQFQFAHGLAVGPGGVVYVSDTINQRVQEFSGTGAYLLS